MTSSNAKLPSEFLDGHHHFVNTKENDFQSFLARFVPNESYLPEQYQTDVVEALRKSGVSHVGSVHLECMPDSGIKEVQWLESMQGKSSVKAIVASCDLTTESVDQELASLKKAAPDRLRGIRWILDCVGEFEPGTATHVATLRHDGIDYLRGGENGDEAMPEFERGFALLETHQLSFDLQCAPVQLPAASRLCAKYPNIPVVIDHLGKPRTLLGPDTPDNQNTVPNQAELETWRTGMKLMAALPHVYVKISMLGYAVPGWIRSAERIDLVRTLCREVVEMFGPKRCIINLNWWKAGSLSDADGLSDVGPTPTEYLQHMANFFDDYSEEDRHELFVGSAKRFYRIK